jgi:acetylornithine deacetylase/succinyl-diaminopimelate desuccinylase-like protein
MTVELEKLAAAPAVSRARALIREQDAQTVQDMLDIVRIPAPPFAEAERGLWLAERMRALGLHQVDMDEAGNVLAHLPGSSASAGESPIILSAHLDTIFPAETRIDVRNEGGRVAAPGIADNTRGLAALLAIARALLAAQPSTIHPIVFVATVGEEGVGDLRGVKHLMRPGSPWRSAAGFITVDGTGLRRIVHRAIGSRRFAVTITGAGGHSWADFGMANPIHALGLAIGELAALELSRQPRVALTVGRAGGGTSVNAIPADAWMEIDLRSEAGRTLLDTENLVRMAIKDAVDRINAQRRRGTPALQLEIRVIGDRPTGETPVTSPLVRIARGATRLINETPELVASSTDANVPIALGIPAIAIGAGGESGGTHTVDEWYENKGGVPGIERALLILLGAAGLR